MHRRRADIGLARSNLPNPSLITPDPGDFASVEKETRLNHDPQGVPVAAVCQSWQLPWSRLHTSVGRPSWVVIPAAQSSKAL
jgi:hypothetical protein